jgi:isopenicillin N synthase-like dioxygenase
MNLVVPTLLILCLSMDIDMILLGDLIQYWTNGLFHSPLHRVVNPSILPSSSSVFTAVEENAANQSSDEYSRQSIVFFSGPLDDCMVEPLAWLPQEEPKPPILFPSIRSKDHLLMKINRTNDTK